MRLLLALLSVLALLAAPITAAAAQASCSGDGRMAAGGMDMPAMPLMHVSGSATTGDPCCGRGGTDHQRRDKSCMQACAAMCSVALALEASCSISAPTSARVLLNMPLTVLAPGLQTSRLERPPKSMA